MTEMTTGKLTSAAVKARRKSQGKILVSVSFAAAVVLATRHFGGPVTTQEFSDHQTSGSSGEAAGLATVPGAEGAGHQPEATATPFIRGLTGIFLTGTDDATAKEKLENLAAGTPLYEVADALAFLQSRPDSEWSRSLHLLLVRRWAEGNPSSAADWVLHSLPGPMRTEAISGIGIVWANQNLSDATAWVRQLPAGKERDAGIISVAYEAAREKPMDAIVLAIELPDDPAREALVRHSATQWATADPRAATDWAQQIEMGGLRTVVISSIATALGNSDPVAAAELALGSLPMGKSQDDAVVGIIQRWAQNEPANTAAWVEQFPAGSLRDIALSNLVTQWADKDSGQAADWLNGARLGESQDVVFGAFANKLAPAFPATAARWAAAIFDDEIREKEIENVTAAWMLRDESAARAWLASRVSHGAPKPPAR